MSVNLASLDHHLSTIGWTIGKLESVIGVKLSGASAQEKRTAWKLILDEEARRTVDIVRLSFPEARVEAIR